MDIIKRVINYSISEDWDAGKKQKYRQVNTFNLILTIISLSGVAVALLTDIFWAAVIEGSVTPFYLLVFLIIKKEKIVLAQNITIAIYELNILLCTAFALHPTGYTLIPLYSPVFLMFMLFPIVAALLDRAIFLHMSIAIGMIILIQVFHIIFERLDINIVQAEYDDIVNMIVIFYSIIVSASLVSWVYSENRKVKDIEIKRNKELQKALKELKLLNEEVQSQRDDLQVLNATKNRFFSIIAHDLRGSFNPILGFSDLLLKELNPGENTHKLAIQVHKSASNLYELLDNLLEWSRSQLKHMKFHPTKISLNQISEETILFFSDFLKDKDISIINNIPDNLLITGDEHQIRTVIRNLLSNAIKFSWENGEVRITATADDEYVTYSISDDGRGIPSNLIDSLFKMDSSISMEGTNKEKGSGLGLLLCSEFIDNHSGRIWAESTEGCGSTFYFTLKKSANI